MQEIKTSQRERGMGRLRAGEEELQDEEGEEREGTGLIYGVRSCWRTRLEREVDAARQGIEGIHRRTSSGGSSRSKEGRLRADWCDGENKEEARAMVVGGMGIPREWRRGRGLDGTDPSF